MAAHGTAPDRSEFQGLIQALFGINLPIAPPAPAVAEDGGGDTGSAKNEGTGNHQKGVAEAKPDATKLPQGGDGSAGDEAHQRLLGDGPPHYGAVPVSIDTHSYQAQLALGKDESKTGKRFAERSFQTVFIDMLMLDERFEPADVKKVLRALADSFTYGGRKNGSRLYKTIKNKLDHSDSVYYRGGNTNRRVGLQFNALADAIKAHDEAGHLTTFLYQFCRKLALLKIDENTLRHVAELLQRCANRNYGVSLPADSILTQTLYQYEYASAGQHVINHTMLTEGTRRQLSGQSHFPLSEGEPATELRGIVSPPTMPQTAGVSHVAYHTSGQSDASAGHPAVAGDHRGIVRRLFQWRDDDRVSELEASLVTAQREARDAIRLETEKRQAVSRFAIAGFHSLAIQVGINPTFVAPDQAYTWKPEQLRTLLNDLQGNFTRYTATGNFGGSGSTRKEYYTGLCHSYDDEDWQNEFNAHLTDSNTESSSTFVSTKWCNFSSRTGSFQNEGHRKMATDYFVVRTLKCVQTKFVELEKSVQDDIVLDRVTIDNFRQFVNCLRELAALLHLITTSKDKPLKPKKGRQVSGGLHRCFLQHLKLLDRIVISSLPPSIDEAQAFRSLYNNATRVSKNMAKVIPTLQQTRTHHVSGGDEEDELGEGGAVRVSPESANGSGGSDSSADRGRRSDSGSSHSTDSLPGVGAGGGRMPRHPSIVSSGLTPGAPAGTTAAHLTRQRGESGAYSVASTVGTTLAQTPARPVGGSGTRRTHPHQQRPPLPPSTPAGTTRRDRGITSTAPTVASAPTGGKTQARTVGTSLVAANLHGDGPEWELPPHMQGL